MDKINENEIKSLDKVWHKLIFVMQKVGTELWKDKLKNISTIEVSILNIVEMKPDVILKDIVNILQIPGSTLTNAVDRLEKKGLIKRTISQKDRRSYGIELTDEGKKAQEEHKKGERILFSQILEGYSSKNDRDELIRQLEKLACQLNRVKGKSGNE